MAEGLSGERTREPRITAFLPPVSGIAFVVLTGIAGIVGDPSRFGPGIRPEQPAAVVAGALAENREALRASAYLTLGGVLFLFFFLACLRAAAQRPDGEGDVLAAVVFGAGLVVAALHLVGASIALAAGELGAVDPVVAQTLLAYGWDYYTVVAAPATAAVAATAVATLRGAALPRWFGWFSAVVAAALVVLLVGRTAGLGTLAFLVWTGVASLALFLKAFARA